MVSRIDCPLTLIDGKWTCPNCGWIYPKERDKPPQRNCPTLISRRPTEDGVGTALHDLLYVRYGLNYHSGCGCRQLVILMNSWGPQECRDNIDLIVGKLLAQAKKRKWKLDSRPLLTAVAKVGAKLPYGMNFARAWARKLVMEAIESCE